MKLVISDVQQAARWRAEIDIDANLGRWQAAGDVNSWGQVSNVRSGAMQWRPQGELILLDKPNRSDKACRPLISLLGMPARENESVTRRGPARLHNMRHPTLSGRVMQWRFGGEVIPGGIRELGLHLCQSNLPTSGVKEPPNCVEDQPRAAGKKDADGNRATGCGGFVGWYFKRLKASGWNVPEDRVSLTYTWTPPDTGKEVVATTEVYFTGPTLGHREIAQHLEKARRQPIYIECKPGSSRRPRPGDVYVIRKPNRMIRHVGVIHSVRGNHWRTADGGQGPSGYGVGFLDRTFDPAKGTITGGTEVGYIDGWIDIESLVASS